MITEIEYAVNFLVETITQNLNISPDQCHKLRARLQHHLELRFENHWYSDKPMKGSAYRCINVSSEDCSVDQVLRQAAEDCAISMKTLLETFSKGLALWVDPNDVSCRLGKGAIFPIYKKISESKKQTISNSPPVSSMHYQRRPQQRPRSISPQHTSNMYIKENQFQTRPRSTTPPGFSVMDAGKLYQNYTSRPSMSNQNLQKVWNMIPNTTSYNTSHTKSTSNSQTSTTTAGIDSSYSFNQYSSYYNPSITNPTWKKNNRTQVKQPKINWQDDESYNRYHWSRKEVNSSMTAADSFAVNNYGYHATTLQAQEVC